MAHKKNKTFKTPMMESCNNNFQTVAKFAGSKDDHFEVAVIGLQTINGRYILNKGQENAALLIEGNKEFSMISALKIVEQINEIKPNLSIGEFKIKVDGIKFECNVQRM